MWPVTMAMTERYQMNRIHDANVDAIQHGANNPTRS
jgi:hypothetical protein